MIDFEFYFQPVALPLHNVFIPSVLHLVGSETKCSTSMPLLSKRLALSVSKAVAGEHLSQFENELWTFKCGDIEYLSFRFNQRLFAEFKREYFIIKELKSSEYTRP